MDKKTQKPADISQQDWDGADIPELTEAEFANGVLFKDAHPEAYAAWKRSPGRPKAETPKVHVGFRLAADVVEGIKATGKGYNARVEAVLREALAAGRLDAPPTDLFDRASAQQDPRQ